MLHVYHCERPGATWSEADRARSGELFFPQSYGTSKQRDISETNDFFDMVYRTKKIIFHYSSMMNRPGRNRPGHVAF